MGEGEREVEEEREEVASDDEDVDGRARSTRAG